MASTGRVHPELALLWFFVLLGNVGFLDQFTVTASRFAQAVAIEDHDAFGERFGTILST